GVPPQHEMVDDDLEVAGVRYARVDPMREWRLTCDADAAVFDLADRGAPVVQTRVALDLVFRALTPAIGVDGQAGGAAGASAETPSTDGKGHLEQAGRWSGWNEAGGPGLEQRPAARGHRDLAWGPPRRRGPEK